MSSRAELHFHLSSLSTLIVERLNNVQGYQFNTHSQEDPRENIHRWLDAADPSSNHKAACLKRQPTTGNWFIEGDVFANWKTSPCQVLWLYGRPGCGKTILSSTIIQDLSEHCHANPPSAMAYFYFDFQSPEKQSCQSLLSSLIAQFFLQVTTTPQSLYLLYSRFAPIRRKPDLDDLIVTLKSIIQELPQAFIVVDALDECIQRQQLFKLIKDMVGWRLNTLHILLTSRKEREIEDFLVSRISQGVDIQGAVIAHDIELHVQESLRNDKKLNKWSANLQEEIKSELTKGAHGMFRWVACQLDELRKCAKLSEVRNTLRSLPKTLDDTYERILINIDELHRDDVLKVLQWLCFSRCPITLAEMVEALAVTFHDGPKFDPDERYADPRDILSRCSSLVSVTATENGDELGLAHFSVKEYLVSDRIQNGRARIYGVIEDRAHVLISRTCLAYLLQFETVDCLNEFTISNYPLAGYAARYWLDHVRFEEDPRSDELLELIMELFRTSESERCTPPFISWVRLHDIADPRNKRALDKASDVIPFPLHYAVLAGMLPVVQAMMERQVDVNASGGTLHGDNALHVASLKGHEGIVELLLQHGADVNAEGGIFGNALKAALIHRHERIVELLLRHGADVNSRTGTSRSALWEASFHGHRRIVELLLQWGADVNAREEQLYGSALQIATSQGHDDIVALLLQYGADVNAEGGPYSCALETAFIRRRERIVDLLLQHGADVGALGGQFDNEVQAALIRVQKAPRHGKACHGEQELRRVS